MSIITVIYINHSQAIKLKLTLQKAKPKHISELCNLVNLAYRGEHGWTKETHLVAGERTTHEEVEGYLSNPNAHLFIALNNNENVIACICIEVKEDYAYFGFFAVHPSLQGAGVGKQILALAEALATKEWKVKKFAMVVISQRKKLISFYERRGYIKTGDINDYPTHLNVGKPLKSGLTITCLEKRLLISKN